MANQIVLFIDGGYLDRILDFLGKLKIDYQKLSNHMANGLPLIRAYYYHCLPYQSPKPTKLENEKFSKDFSEH